MYKLIAPLFLLLAVALVAGSCNKNLDTKCPAVDFSVPDSQKTALAYLIDSAKIKDAVYDGRGFYYTIIDTGIGMMPTPCNVINVNYSGRLWNGNLFDSGHNVQFALSQLIKGWQLGLPMIRNGGIIRLYLPPALAYGASVTPTIPANSSLIFNIELGAVK